MWTVVLEIVAVAVTAKLIKELPDVVDKILDKVELSDFIPDAVLEYFDDDNENKDKE